MKWLSMSKWRNWTSPPAVTDAFHSSSGELTDASSSAAPWSPSYASSNPRSSSSLSTGSSSGSSTTGSPTAASRSSFVKRMFSRMGRAGGDGGGASPRASSSGRKRPQNPYAADGHDDDFSAATAADDDEFSHKSLWQRSILRGERCEAPAFSGLILYDAAGNRISQLPAKSPLHPALVPPALD